MTALINAVIFLFIKTVYFFILEYKTYSLNDKFYPVGCIVYLYVATNPQTLFGFGTWSQMKDRFLLGKGDTYTGNIGTTGGTATHTHTTGNHTLTINEMPAHNHAVTNAPHYFYYDYAQGADALVAIDTSGNGYHWKTFNTGTSNRGGGAAHNHGNTGSSSNMPPYIIVYIWRRTA